MYSENCFVVGKIESIIVCDRLEFLSGDIFKLE